METNPMHVDITNEAPIIVMSRIFDAPREVVWAALTNPKHVAQWYGGHGFANPVCEMDVRPGGLWNHVMRTPSGMEFPIHSVYLEVVKPEKLSWQDVDHGKRKPGQGPPTSIKTITLEESGPSKTKWTLVTRFNSLAERDETVKMGFTGTLAEGCEKFNDLVKKLSQS